MPNFPQPQEQRFHPCPSMGPRPTRPGLSAAPQPVPQALCRHGWCPAGAPGGRAEGAFTAHTPGMRHSRWPAGCRVTQASEPCTRHAWVELSSSTARGPPAALNVWPGPGRVALRRSESLGASVSSFNWETGWLRAWFPATGLLPDQHCLSSQRLTLVPHLFRDSQASFIFTFIFEKERVSACVRVGQREPQAGSMPSRRLMQGSIS